MQFHTIIFFFRPVLDLKSLWSCKYLDLGEGKGHKFLSYSQLNQVFFKKGYGTAVHTPPSLNIIT
jgi:hypothetical protein